MSPRSIYIVGPSSTGKTTLVTALAKRLGLTGPALVQEVAREVIRQRNFTRKDIGKLGMQQAILEAQLKQEERGRGSYPIQLCDRSGVDPVVYAVMTASGEEEREERVRILTETPKFQNALRHYQNSVFVLLAPVPEWLVDDGVRHLDDQEKTYEIFKVILVRLGIPYREIGRDMRRLEERIMVVMGLARL